MTINEVIGIYGRVRVTQIANFLGVEPQDRTAELIERELRSRGVRPTTDLADIDVTPSEVLIVGELDSALHVRLSTIGKGGRVRWIGLAWEVIEAAARSDLFEARLRTRGWSADGHADGAERLCISDLRRLRDELPPDHPVPFELVVELLDFADMHRARVQVNDEDIVAAGFGGCQETCKLAVWCDQTDGIHYERGNVAADGSVFTAGFWTSDPRTSDSFRLLLSWTHTEPRMHTDIINALAEAVGRAPLDVLDEIAAMEVPRG